MTTAAGTSSSAPKAAGLASGSVKPVEPRPASKHPRHPPAKRTRTVAGRLLGSFLVVLAAFALTVGWTFRALRDAARDAELLRAGYVPMSLRIGEALAEQNVFITELNQITSTALPAEVRAWISTAVRTRPITFGLLREAAASGVGADTDPRVREKRESVAAEATAIEQLLAADQSRFAELTQALKAGDREVVELARKDMVLRDNEAARRLRLLKTSVEEGMQNLTTEAKRREEQSMQLLVGLAFVTLLVGAVTSLYARRVLAPLTAVTERANAVARGDLTPHEVVATNDEIGELATTFEGMVAAIERARSELVAAERLATIGKMAAHVTHEIRNPLSSIGLNVELLEEEIAELSAGAEPRQLVVAIKGEVDRLSRLAEQYLSVARRPRPELARERVEDLVREIVAFVRPELERASVLCVVTCDDGLPEIELDESLFRQALLNLVRNAREAMPKGGTITVTVARSEQGVSIAVDDEGGGVPEALRPQIFDPFFTTKQRGTGLGLAVTKEIVVAHHGSIACEPRAEGGTRFRIDLPAP